MNTPICGAHQFRQFSAKTWGRRNVSKRLVERFGVAEIAARDFDVRGQVGGLGIAGQCADPATAAAQLRDDFATDVAGCAGDQDATHEMRIMPPNTPIRMRRRNLGYGYEEVA